MARRRYRKSHQVVESHIREEESPWHSLFHPTIRDLVKSSRSIAHSNDFEGHKLIQTNSRQLFLLDLKILYWCPASRDHVKPLVVHIGTASNFLQCKWVSCSKSYWQGYDLAWYKDMEAPCFPQPNLWLARCASRSWAALRKFVVLSTQASKQQQAAASSRQEASKQQASSKQASQQASQPASQQAAASSSKQQASQPAAGKQQQASTSKQAATSVCPLERMNKYKL